MSSALAAPGRTHGASSGAQHSASSFRQPGAEASVATGRGARACVVGETPTIVVNASAGDANDDHGIRTRGSTRPRYHGATAAAK
jgi:hypothetical protein